MIQPLAWLNHYNNDYCTLDPRLLYAIETLNLYQFTDAKPFPVDLRQRNERLNKFF